MHDNLRVFQAVVQHYPCVVSVQFTLLAPRSSLEQPLIQMGQPVYQMFIAFAIQGQQESKKRTIVKKNTTSSQSIAPVVQTLKLRQIDNFNTSVKTIRSCQIPKYFAIFVSSEYLFVQSNNRNNQHNAYIVKQNVTRTTIQQW